MLLMRSRERDGSRDIEREAADTHREREREREVRGGRRGGGFEEVGAFARK